MKKFSLNDKNEELFSNIRARPVCSFPPFFKARFIFPEFGYGARQSDAQRKEGPAVITQLYRYPVKGLSPEPRQTLQLLAGEGIRADRAIAIARKPGVFDHNAPVAQPKHKFLMLMRDAALAALRTSYDDERGILTIAQPDGPTLEADLSNTAGCQAVEAFLKRYLGDAALAPQVVQAPGHKFTDISVSSPQKMRAISLINIQSVKALEAAQGFVCDPLRFRANVYFDGSPAWEELSWVGKEIMIGGARARVVMRTRRCAATQVNPRTAQRDEDVPAYIKAHFGHFDMGVYAEVLSTADIEIGGRVSLV